MRIGILIMVGGHHPSVVSTEVGCGITIGDFVLEPSGVCGLAVKEPLFSDMLRKALIVGMLRRGCGKSWGGTLGEVVRIRRSPFWFYLVD